MDFNYATEYCHRADMTECYVIETSECSAVSVAVFVFLVTLQYVSRFSGCHVSTLTQGADHLGSLGG